MSVGHRHGAGSLLGGRGRGPAAQQHPGQMLTESHIQFPWEHTTRRHTSPTTEEPSANKNRLLGSTAVFTLRKHGGSLGDGHLGTAHLCGV